MTVLRPALCALALSLVLPGAAVAADPHAPAHGAAPEAHGPAGHAPEAGHGADAAHGADADGHGGDAHHVDWTGDEDHDGVPTWRDPTTGTEANPDYKVVALGWHLFNLFLILGGIAWLARRPVSDAVRNRAHDIRKEITETARMRDEARQRHEELGARLAKFEDEVARMRAQAAEDARKEEQKLIERARTEAERIGQTADRTIRDEVMRAQIALRREAVDLAVKLAESTLRAEVGPNDQKRLARQFLDSLNTTGGSNGHG